MAEETEAQMGGEGEAGGLDHHLSPLGCPRQASVVPQM